MDEPKEVWEIGPRTTERISQLGGDMHLVSQILAEVVRQGPQAYTHESHPGAMDGMANDAALVIAMSAVAAKNPASPRMQVVPISFDNPAYPLVNEMSGLPSDIERVRYFHDHPELAPYVATLFGPDYASTVSRYTVGNLGNFLSAQWNGARYVMPDGRTMDQLSPAEMGQGNG